jgi:hypothetical protein
MLKSGAAKLNLHFYEVMDAYLLGRCLVIRGLQKEIDNYKINNNGNT